jgi:hypothetical protein
MERSTEITEAIEATKTRILTAYPNARSLSFGHNEYCYGVFFDGLLHGLFNHEFMPILDTTGKGYMCADIDIEI